METVILRNHPELVANCEIYKLIDDYADGSPARVAEYLIKYGFEHDEIDERVLRHYRSRIERLDNHNFVERALKLHTGHMAQPIRLSGINEKGPLEQIKKDVTGRGVDYTRAARKRLALFCKDGRNGTLVDGPASIAVNERGARSAGERTYQIIYNATQIRNWDWFTSGPRMGQLSEVILAETPLVDAQGNVFDRVRRFRQPEDPDAPFLWDILVAVRDGDANHWFDKEREYRIVGGTREGRLREIPFVLWGDGPGDGFVRAVARANRIHMNMMSVRDNVLYYTGFQKIAMTGVAPEEIEKWAEAAILLLGNENARLLQIDPVNPEGLTDRQSMLERYIDRIIKFEYNQLADDTRQVQSSDSKAKDMVVRKVIYNDTLDDLTNVERRIWRFMAMMEGESPDAIDVTIGREFGLEDPEEERQDLLAAETSASNLGCVEWQREIAKIHASKLRYLPSEKETAEQVRERVYAAIDAADPTASRAGDLFGSLGGNLFQSAPPAAEQ